MKKDAFADVRKLFEAPKEQDNISDLHSIKEEESDDDSPMKSNKYVRTKEEMETHITELIQKNVVQNIVKDYCTKINRV